VSSATDPLTAAADAVPRRNPDVLTLGDCWRSFIRRPSPPLLGAAIAVAIALRIALGHFDWRDPVIVAGVLAATPPVEWLIHVYLLHARPLEVGRHRYELLAAREHRAHHESPAELDGVLLPIYGVLIFIPMIAATVWALSFPVHAVLGGPDRLAHAATGLVISYLILGAYEWSHYLIHTPYRPRGRYYRAIWRGHRLHHYKNEHFWFGVTSPFADRVLGTAPEQATVPKSETARTLGAEAP
jgi:sterol desaturase/sphingolipid hydroxylase (fatty acid hydroxylase superfamily)